MITITIKKVDNSRRGPVTRTLEIDDFVSLPDWIGALDGLLRQSFPEGMRRRCLNLSNDTGVAQRSNYNSVQDYYRPNSQPGNSVPTASVQSEDAYSDRFSRNQYTANVVLQEALSNGADIF